jgi:hypothetical protein
MVEAADQDQILSKRKVVSALLPYAIYLGRDGQPEMFDAILRVARAQIIGDSCGIAFTRYIISLFDRPSSPSLDRAIVLTSPYLFWNTLCEKENMATNGQRQLGSPV